MAGAHEHVERAEHVQHVAHAGHGETSSAVNKKIALLIAILALFLALAETLGKSAQTDALSYNVEASNLWAFFQAKTIRQTAVRTAGEMVELNTGAMALTWLAMAVGGLGVAFAGIGLFAPHAVHLF
jgi:Domain of unknown function (DUF4337)